MRRRGCGTLSVQTLIRPVTEPRDIARAPKGRVPRVRAFGPSSFVRTSCTVLGHDRTNLWLLRAPTLNNGSQPRWMSLRYAPDLDTFLTQPKHLIVGRPPFAGNRNYDLSIVTRL